MIKNTPKRCLDGPQGKPRKHRGIARTALLAAGLALGAMTAAAEDLKVVRYVGFSEPKTLDPVASWLAVSFQHSYMVYDTLFSRDAEGQAQPEMVDSWEISDDNKTFTFTLRDGLMFHDGSPVEAADAVASIKRWAQKDSAGKMLVSFGMDYEVIDAKTFKVTLEQPSLFLIDAFAKPTVGPLFVMREEEASKFSSTEPVDTIIGSGPFKFVKEEHRPGAKLVYAKNEEYIPRDEPPSWLAGGKKVNIDRVEWVVMPDPSSTLNALLTGEIDVYERPPLDLLPIMEADPNVALEVVNEHGMIGYIRPNHTQVTFDTQAGRQALSYAIDQAEFLRAVAGVDGKYWSECYSFFGCGGRYETEAGMEGRKDPDPEKAKALLEEAGYNGEMVAVLGASNSTILKEFSITLANTLKNVGVNVDLRLSDIASMLASRKNRDIPENGGWSMFPMTSMSFTLDDPIGNFWLASKCEENIYAGWPCNDHMEELLAAWAHETDPEKAKELTRQIQVEASEDLPIVLLGQVYYPVAHRTSVTDLVKAPQTVFWGMNKS